MTSDEARIALADAGPGLPAEFVATAFLPFARRATARGKAGSGLGLSVVKGIAEAHGGHVAWQAHGAGSCFTLHLPRYQTGGQSQ